MSKPINLSENEKEKIDILENEEVSNQNSFENTFSDNENPENIILKKEKSELINKMLNDLPSKHEKEVITMRFGLDDGHPKSYEEIGKHYNVTGERIKKIEAKALRRLKNPLRIDKYRKYLEE